MGVGSTDASGYFSVAAEVVDPTSTYEASGVAGGEAFIYDFTVPIPATTTSGPDVGASGRATATTQPATVVIQAGVGPLTTQVPTNRYKYAYVPVRAMDTAYHSSQDYSYATAKKTRPGIALNIAGKYSFGGVAYGVSASSGQDNTFHAGNQSLSTRLMQWNYRYFRKYCYDLGVQYPLDVYRWAGIDAAGGSRSRSVIPGISCPYTHPINSVTSLSTSVTFTWKGWYSIAGVTVDSTQEQSASTRTVITPDNRAKGNDEVDPTYCSMARTMAGSNLIKERQ